MSLILIYIALAFTAVALVLMVLPLFGTRRERVRIEFIEHELRTIEALASERSALLQQLRDLEFDRETNKVSEEDYARFKRRYELQAVAVMRQLDALRGGQNWDRLVDQEIASHTDGTFPAGEESDIAEASDASDPDVSPVAVDETDDEPHASESLADASDHSEVEEQPEEETEEDTEDETASDADAEIRCGSCGEELAADDRFCRKCGAATPESQTDAEEVSA